MWVLGFKHIPNSSTKVREPSVDAIVFPPDTPLFYANYKQPLRPVEDGYGYYGTIATSQDRDFIQCHVCGRLFRGLGRHINMHHALTGREYKGQLREGLVKYDQDVQSGKIKHDGNKARTAGGRSSAATLKGCAPTRRCRSLTTSLGGWDGTPSCDEFTREYNGWYISQITTYFGSWTNALRMAGMVTVGEMRTQTRSPEMLLSTQRLLPPSQTPTDTH